MHDEPMMPHAPESYLMFLFRAMGIRYTVLLPAAAMLTFVLVLVLVLRGKGSTLPGALFFIVPLPLLIGCIGVVEGLLSSFQVIAASSSSPKPSEWAQGFSMMLVTGWIGALLTIPSYLVATIGLIARSFGCCESGAIGDSLKR